MIVTPHTYRAKDKIGARISLLTAVCFPVFFTILYSKEAMLTGGAVQVYFFFQFLTFSSFCRRFMSKLLNTVKFSREKFGLRI